MAIKEDKLYHRIMINGVLYTSSGHHRSLNASDNVFCFVDDGGKLVGCVLKFVSICKSDCTDCFLPCQHMAIVESPEVCESHIVTNTISGATTKHHHIVNTSRYT